MAGVIRDKGAVGDNGQVGFCIGQLVGQKGAAASAFDHNGISAADKFRGPRGNFSLLLIVIGDPSVDVILAAKKGKAVFPLDDASGLQSVQVLADRYLGDSQFFGQKGHFQPLFLGQQF